MKMLKSWAGGFLHIITQSLFQISIRKKLLKMFAEVFPRHVPRVNMIIKAGP